MSTVAAPSVPAQDWFWEQAASLVTEPDDGQTVVLTERSARAGAMPPLHVRDAHETYRVLEGEITFYVGMDFVTAGVGDVIVAPQHAPRTFRVESARARWLVLTQVASPQRFQDFSRAVATAQSGSATDWPSAEEHGSVAAMARVNGIELLGPPGALPDRG